MPKRYRCLTNLDLGHTRRLTHFCHDKKCSSSRFCFMRKPLALESQIQNQLEQQFFWLALILHVNADNRDGVAPIPCHVCFYFYLITQLLPSWLLILTPSPTIYYINTTYIPIPVLPPMLLPYPHCLHHCITNNAVCAHNPYPLPSLSFTPPQSPACQRRCYCSVSSLIGRSHFP
jgi:hypothetical protein